MRPGQRLLSRAGLWLLLPALALIAGVFIAPLVLMLPTSFRPYVPGQGMLSTWTLENYAILVADTFYLEIFLRTLIMGLSVTLLTLVIGYPLAYWLARSESKLRGLVLLLVVFPLLLNLVVRSFGWIALLARNGLINEFLIGLGIIDEPLALIFNLTGLIIGMTHIFLPFMVLTLIGAIQTIPRDVEDAAGVLGANRLTTFWKVTCPLSLPGILAGSVLVFVLSVSALVTPRLLGGPTYQVMSTVIFEEFTRLLNWPGGSAMAFVLTLLVLLLIWLSGRAAGRLGRVR
ncbi:MAG: ABC transporter permease [Kiloniellales bacterium]|nr:ABC transporter permease [Kiloniellales bacterium]